MSSIQDTKSAGLNSNSGRISDAQISDNFNKTNALEDKIKGASPQAQSQIRDRMQLRDERMEMEKKSQKRFHGQRVQKEASRLYKEYILSDAPRPDTAAAREQDVAIIEQQAEELVTAKEEYFLGQIERQAENDIYHLLSRDRQQQQSHAHDRSDPEQER
jgi:hypothetical protein